MRAIILVEYENRHTKCLAHTQTFSFKPYLLELVESELKIRLRAFILRNFCTTAETSEIVKIAGDPVCSALPDQSLALVRESGLQH